MNSFGIHPGVDLLDQIVMFGLIFRGNLHTAFQRCCCCILHSHLWFTAFQFLLIYTGIVYTQADTWYSWLFDSSSILVGVRRERACFNYIVFFVLLHFFVVLFLSVLISSLRLELKSLFGFFICSFLNSCWGEY